MSRSQARLPRVFLSYSHDSPAHCQWVAKLATRLRAHGIDAVLDQWNLRPGQDVVAFMEQEIRRADRVLVVCTDDYVAKAERGAGGVGYERMIVTAELMRDVDTTKFIPVVRRCRGERRLPTFLGTRMYVDLSSGRFGQTFLGLVRELHGAEPLRAPLGPVVVDTLVPIERPAPRRPRRPAARAPAPASADPVAAAPEPARPLAARPPPSPRPIAAAATRSPSPVATPPPPKEMPEQPRPGPPMRVALPDEDLPLVTTYVTGRLAGRRFVSCSECGFDLFELQPGEEPDPTKEYRHPYNCLDDG